MRDKLQAIIEDAQDDNYSDSPRFVDAILELLAPTIEKAEAYDALGYTTAYIEPENYQEIKDKAAKWDRATEVINPSHLYALAEWIDLKYPNDSDPEVQTDLRRLGNILAGKEDEDG